MSPVSDTTRYENTRGLGTESPYHKFFLTLQGGDTGVGRCERTSVISLN
jgi:hypothetical protein